MKIIDLSLEVKSNIGEPIEVIIKRISHKEGADILGRPSNIDHKCFPDEMGLSLEIVTLTTHTSTHIDAPLHYGPYCENKKSKSISELPLEWFYSNGVVLNCVNINNNEPVTKDEIINKIDEIQYKLNPLDIVLIRTDADKLWGNPEYFKKFRGVTKEATEWLVSKGIKVIGVDSFGFDPPFQTMLDQYNKTKDKNCLWPAHIYGRKKEYCQIERLANLSHIEHPFGFKVACFPIKIEDCGAGWSRVVAIIEEQA